MPFGGQAYVQFRGATSKRVAMFITTLYCMCTFVGLCDDVSIQECHRLTLTRVSQA